MKALICLIFILGLPFSVYAAKCSIELERLLKGAQMSEKVFPVNSVHRGILEVVSTVSSAQLIHVKKVDNPRIAPDKDLWEYVFRFSGEGPELEFRIRENSFYVSSFVSKGEGNHFSIHNYIRHISNREEAFRITDKYRKGEISSEKMFELKMKQLKELFRGELGEILRGEKWIDIPDYTMNDYR